LKEKVFEIGAINPVELFGINDSNLDIIKGYFPKLKIIARGTTVKVIGDDEQILQFEKKLEIIIDHFNKYGTLTEANIEHLILEEVTKCWFTETAGSR
jgi:phosphate starvation-inducible protein PhoH and related proteins